MNDDLKRITILHSNDIHGQFTGETGKDGKLRGSLAQVAGFVAQTKEDNPNTLYCIAGDVFQGSLIDSDYQGLGSRIDDRCIIRGNVGGLALEVKSGKRKRGLLE